MSLEAALNRHSDLMERFLPLLERALERVTTAPRDVSADEPAGSHDLVLDTAELLRPEPAPAPLPQSAPATRAPIPHDEKAAEPVGSTREAFRQINDHAQPVKRGPGRPPKAATPAKPIRSGLEPDDTSAAFEGDVPIGGTPLIPGMGPALPELVEDDEESLAAKRLVVPVGKPIVEAIASWDKGTPENATAHEIVQCHGASLSREDARQIMTGYMGPEGSPGRPQRLAKIGEAIAYVGRATGTTIAKFADVPDEHIRTIVDQLGVILGVYMRDPVALAAKGPDPF